MITQDFKTLIENNPVSFATVDSSNKPNVIGVASVKVISKNQLIISDVHMKQTKSNLEKNKNVCLAVWDNKWSGCKMIGTAEYFDSGIWLDYVKNIPENKNPAPKGAIVITLTKLIKLS